MDYLAFGPYFVALVAYAASPGPLMAVLVARSLGNDWKGATVFAAGLCVGEVIAVIAVVLGIGLWAQTNPELLAIAKYAGAAYLFWLAAKMWRDRASVSAAQLGKAGWLASACAGLALCLGNPATLLMQMLLLPLVAPAGVTSFEHMALVVLVTFAAFGIVFFGTIPLARQLNRIISSPGSSSTVNRMTAGAIAVTSIWILAA
ncbi:MAG TPA: LysE family translocator [Rhizobiaceae bacterium]|nr:LysE family translocator [Rhizobiaceae bacterium]